MLNFGGKHTLKRLNIFTLTLYCYLCKKILNERNVCLYYFSLVLLQQPSQQSYHTTTTDERSQRNQLVVAHLNFSCHQHPNLSQLPNHSSQKPKKCAKNVNEWTKVTMIVMTIQTSCYSTQHYLVNLLLHAVVHYMK